MPFKTELDLVEIFQDSYFKDLKNSHCRILNEVGVGFGIADFVISEPKTCISDNLRREKFSDSDIAVYLIVEKCNLLKIDDIARMSGLRKSSILHSLKILAQSNLTVKINDYYILSEKYELSFNSAIAFEAKLKNWQRALTQAYRYRWFADISYVVLDEHFAHKALENIVQFKNANVGLITLSDVGKITYHHSPLAQKPIDPSMQMSFSEYLLFN